MGLDTVVEDIKEEAEAKAESIISEAESEAEEILDEAKQEAKQIKKDKREKSEKEAEELREHELSSAKLESRKMVSTAEKDLLNEIREEVMEELAELSDGRKDLTQNLLDAAIDELDADEGAVYTSAQDEDMVNDILDEKDGFSYKDHEEIVGGVIVESMDGRVRINNSFDSIFKSVWNDNLREFSRELLGED